MFLASSGVLPSARQCSVFLWFTPRITFLLRAPTPPDLGRVPALEIQHRSEVRSSGATARVVHLPCVPYSVTDPRFGQEADILGFKWIATPLEAQSIFENQSCEKENNTLPAI